MEEQGPKTVPATVQSMTFAQAVQRLEAGATVRRVVWHKGVKGIRKGNNPNAPEKSFVLLTGDYGTSRWNPYFADFLATDWVVVKEGQ